MVRTLCLNENYSTTRLLTQKKPKIINSPEDKFQTILSLPEGEGRKGEGGLRTKGYFKQSYDDKPLISIITVVFNSEKYLEETIQSVISQNYDNVEHIIIDGASTDGTVDIIKKYEDQIDYWISEKDNGIYDAMNKGLDLVSGEWVNFMNAGDGFYDSEVLEKIFLKNKFENIDVIYGKSISYYKDYQSLRYKNFEAQKEKWYLSKMPNHQSVFIRKKRYKNLKYNLSYKYNADTVYLREIFSMSAFYEVQDIVNRFELGGRSNFYGDFKTYKYIILDGIKLHNSILKPYVLHTIKFLLQKLLGKDLYFKFYFKYIIKK